MDAVLSLPLFVGFALVAVVALLLLKQTRLFWLPGAALMGYGVAVFYAWPWYDTHDGVGFEGLSNLLHVIASLVVVAGGLECVIAGARSRRRAGRIDIPKAIVAKDAG